MKPTFSQRIACACVCAVSIGLSVGGSSLGQSAVAPEEALKRAAANEQKLKAAERDFFYRQDILVQTFGEANSVSAQLHRVSEMTYDSAGNRTEKILEYPPSPLTVPLGVLQPDFKALLGVDLFFLMPDLVPNYTIKFAGRQKIDDLSTYVFDIEPADPKNFPKRDKGDHPFKGKIWIDDQDFEMVKFEGRAVVAKDESSRFPKFECYRENVERNLWLPSLAYARDVLDLKRVDLPIKIEIKYTGYKRIKPGR
ncbi:MAG TPA: hypothetical protein VLM38_18985 [Blastocatellia bacterium]|nr:hypothetical protein [Blastocatellia bacterium]